jgi:hypothetical protein
VTSGWVKPRGLAFDNLQLEATFFIVKSLETRAPGSLPAIPLQNPRPRIASRDEPLKLDPIKAFLKVGISQIPSGSSPPPSRGL